MTLGILVGFIVFGIFVLNVDKYISFMNMDYNIYVEFTIYSIIQLYISAVFSFVLEKLYFEDKEKLANKYCIQMNMINFISLVISSILFENKWGIVSITLLSIFIYVLIVTIKQYRKFKFKIHILKYIKYESVEIINNLLFFFFYLFGLSNTSEFDDEYIIVLNFVTLLTDCQWDTFDTIITVAKIDIAQKNFDYKTHIKNSYKLLFILFSTIIIMFLITYKFYNTNLILLCIYLGFDFINFLMYPIYSINTCYLQLESSTVKITFNKLVASILRFMLSLLKTPLCTGIGQTVSSIYQYISTSIMIKMQRKNINSSTKNN